MGTLEGACWRIGRDAAVVVGLVFAVYLFMVSAGQKGSMAFDVVAYWQVDLAQPYGGTSATLASSPTRRRSRWRCAPFTHCRGWSSYGLVRVAYRRRRLARPAPILTLLAFPPVAIDLYHGNIHLLLAVAIVLGFRYPAAWAFVLLTKVTPGIGLLWFAARGEWRKLGIALGFTAAIVAVTFVFMPAGGSAG